MCGRDARSSSNPCPIPSGLTTIPHGSAFLRVSCDHSIYLLLHVILTYDYIPDNEL